MAAIEASQKSQAVIMAIGTANPPNSIEQSMFPDFYFRVTNSEHMVDLKQRFQRICDKSKIKKRHFIYDEELLRKHQCLCSYDEPSLNARQDIAVAETPKLGAAAAAKAIEEWGQPKSRITHLIFCTSLGVDMPGADFRLMNLLSLRPSVARFMLYKQACFAGGTALRLAKDLAENNKGARVLIVCVEGVGFSFRGPSAHDMYSLVGMSLFGDGASAALVGAEPDTAAGECRLYSIVSAMQTTLPGSERAIEGHIREEGLTTRITKEVPARISENIERCLEEAFGPLGISDWNSIFWAVHPGGPAVLEGVERMLGLKPEKLRASMAMLRDYGNLSSASVLFILDEIRKRSAQEGKATTGEGLEWGVLLGFGPGITVETVVLRSAPRG